MKTSEEILKDLEQELDAIQYEHRGDKIKFNRLRLVVADLVELLRSANGERELKPHPDNGKRREKS